MFKYIDMPKLVAFYLREFSLRTDGTTSNLYKFIFCLCLPFVSAKFRKARLIALAIAECTNSQDQIIRLLETITGATITITPFVDDSMVSYDGSAEIMMSYDGSAEDDPMVVYEPVANAGIMNIQLNGASKEQVSAYLDLLIPFYVKLQINFS